MKVTCYGCRALTGGPQTFGGYRCALGYGIDNLRAPRPLVECPKPRTNAGLCHWLSIRTASGGSAPLYERGDNRHGPK